jgi:hypothetical protein
VFGIQPRVGGDGPRPVNDASGYFPGARALLVAKRPQRLRPEHLKDALGLAILRYANFARSVGTVVELDSGCIAAAILASESLTLHMNNAIPTHEMTATISENIARSFALSSSRTYRRETLGNSCWITKSSRAVHRQAQSPVGRALPERKLPI